MNTEIKETSDYAGCYAPELRCDKERAALEVVLRSTGIDALEAALVAREALECGRGRVRRARERTVTFRKAVEMALEEREKKNRRARTVTDFRYYCKRLMVRNPGLVERRVRASHRMIAACTCRRRIARVHPSTARLARY